MHSKTKTVFVQTQKKKNEETARCKWSSHCKKDMLHLNRALRHRQVFVFGCTVVHGTKLENEHRINWCERFTIEKCVLWRRDIFGFARISADRHKSIMQKPTTTSVYQECRKKKTQTICYMHRASCRTEKSKKKNVIFECVVSPMPQKIIAKFAINYSCNL